MINSNRFSFFPTPAEDETTYSWVSRYHLMAGHRSFRSSTLAMLGVAEGRASNEFPCFLPKLSVAADMPLGTIIHYMTPYRYYATFLPERLQLLLWECLSSGQTHNLQSVLGTVANRITPGQLLFSCRHCIKEDLEGYGFPFWHLAHQLTGVLACHRHHEILHAVPRIKSQAILPVSIIKRPSTNMEWRYASLIQDMSDQINLFSQQQCLLAYRRRLSDMDMTTTHSCIRFRQLRKLVEQQLKGIKGEARAFGSIRQQLSKSQFPECLFYQTHVNHHPLKHLVLIEALFEDWPEFVVEVSKVDVVEEAPPLIVPKREQSTEISAKAKRLLQLGQSLRKVIKVVGLSVSTLKILAHKAGVFVDCRPSKIFVETERAIWRLLMIGKKTTDIALEFGISVGAVEQVLRKHSELVTLRKRIWLYYLQKFHRKAILKHIDLNPFDSRKLIRQALGASYIWLYKHDKAWLYQHLPPAIPRSQRFKITSAK